MPEIDPPPLPTLAEIEEAAAVIRPHVPPTPCYEWPLLSQATGSEVWIKHENHTPLGAFKVRGGLVYLRELKRSQPHLPGVIAASTGNHGQSIAFAAKVSGIRAVIVVPWGNNAEKNASMRALGAELVEHGRDFQEALEHSRELAAREGLHAVPSFHPWLVRGVASYGVEMLRAIPDLEAVFVPIGLGSGFCGLAAARTALRLNCKLVGVVSAHAPAYALSFRERRFVTHPSQTAVAEGVACSTPNAQALEWVRAYADSVMTVTDDQVLAAMRDLWQATHNLPEGAGALSFAALQQSGDRWRGRRVACVMSGGNASTAILAKAFL